MTGNMPAGMRTSVSLSSLDTVKVVIGSEGDKFFIPRRLLASCEYFRTRLDFSHIIRLEGQCPAMFKLFEYWLFERRNFNKFVEEAERNRSCDTLHWDLVNLQLFAANIGECALQDMAMDALQDLYLRRNWEIDPQLVKYVYTECYYLRNLRKWIVAMIAWGVGDTEADGARDTIRDLFDKCAGLWEEYNNHLGKVAASKLEVDYKNPQLRLPSNRLRNGERQFGYRQCSFHTHRSTVGQGHCPHARPPSPLIYSPLTDVYIESDSDHSDSRFESRMASPSTSALTVC
ncbi:hypothetical protein GGS20DRAFT_460137 [Poronia punctata]|nr:hypothetical protein GGS20DRAFT_460137 [Poronia punctata]